MQLCMHIIFLRNVPEQVYVLQNDRLYTVLDCHRNDYSAVSYGKYFFMHLHYHSAAFAGI